MEKPKHSLSEIRAFFQEDRYATEATGIVIEEARPGYARVSLTLEPRHKNAAGRVMGAVYYTMADFAFAVASNADLEDGPLTLTMGGHILFLAAAEGDTLIAEATALRTGRTSAFYEMTVKDSRGVLCAKVQSEGCRIARR